MRPVFLRSALRAGPAGGYGAGADGARGGAGVCDPSDGQFGATRDRAKRVSNGISVGMDAGKGFAFGRGRLDQLLCHPPSGTCAKGADRRYFLRRKGPSGHRRGVRRAVPGFGVFPHPGGKEAYGSRLIARERKAESTCGSILSRLSSGLTLSSTGIAPGLPPREGALPQKAARYQALFDAMIREVDRR